MLSCSGDDDSWGGLMRFDADVVVVGGGIAGAGVAAELSADHRVILLEHEEQAGIHATGRSAALHSEIYGNACIRALTQASRAFFLEGGSATYAQARGCLHIATKHQLSRLESFARQPSVASVVRRIDGKQARDRVPVLRADHVVAALEERHAYDLDVDAIHRSYLSLLRQNGGSLRCSSQVTALDNEGGTWLVTGGQHHTRARIVINAAGAWGDVVAARAGVRPVGLEPRRRTALTVDPPIGVDPRSWPAVIDIDEQFYFKPEAGRVLMSPADETPSDPCDAYPEDMDIAIAVDRVQRVADIPVRRIAHSWAGLRTFAADKTPVVGFDPDVPGFFWLVGQGGYGIQTSPALSRLAAELVRGRAIPCDLVDRGIAEDDLSPRRLRQSAKSNVARVDEANLT